jgi:hypothetical protein
MAFHPLTCSRVKQQGKEMRPQKPRDPVSPTEPPESFTQSNHNPICIHTIGVTATMAVLVG